MSDLPQEFDLKFLPDWLKESPTENRYANHEGDPGERRRGGGDDRRGGGGDRRPPRPGGGGGERRGPRPPQGGNRPGGGPRSDRPPGARRPDDRGPRKFGRDDRGQDDRAPRESRPDSGPAPAQLKIEFLPEPAAGAGIARQIKSSGRAYAVFGTAKLFLERPERHRVRLTSVDAAVLLHQIGTGPISFDRATIERNAFLTAREEFYREETVQGEEIKGSYRNVARCRATGALLGPTNHHGYQPALRKLYEERYSRRMSFQEFQSQEIAVVSDEQTIADWKEQARSSTTWTTLKEAEPVTFATLFEAEQHFKKHYLPTLVTSALTLECSGAASRAGVDRHVSSAVRAAWEDEMPFPQQIVNHLRPYFNEAGLHFFKHRKRMLFVCAHKPLRHALGVVLSDGISAILATIESTPRCKRPDLAKKLLCEHHDSPELASRKSALASDLHYLILAGHVIEFADGALELPLPPKPPEQKGAGNAAKKGGKATPAEADEAAEESEEDGGEPESIAEEAPEAGSESPAEVEVIAEVAPTESHAEPAAETEPQPQA